MLSFLRKKSPAAPTAAYRLRAWPELPPRCGTAAVFRSLSRMYAGPVSLTWFARNAGMETKAADALLELLVLQGAVEKINLMPLRGMHPEYAS